MKPHMAHIANTVARQQAAEKALDSPYARYWALVEKARASGYDDELIIEELEAEAERVRYDEREGDRIFQKGLDNSKVSCLAALMSIIAEIKGPEESK